MIGTKFSTRVLYYYFGKGSLNGLLKYNLTSEEYMLSSLAVRMKRIFEKLANKAEMPILKFFRRQRNAYDWYEKLIVIMLLMAIISVAIIFPYIFLVVTFCLAWFAVRPMLMDKVIHLKSFYGDVRMSTTIKPTIKDQAIVLTELLVVFGGAIALSCPLSSSFTYLFATSCLCLFYLSFHILDRVIGGVNVKYSHKRIRAFYFKGSLVIGLLFSVISFLFEESSLFDTVINALGADFCSAIQLLNNITDKIASLLPSPLDVIVKVVISIKIAAGFVFSLYALIIIKMKFYVYDWVKCKK